MARAVVGLALLFCMVLDAGVTDAQQPAAPAACCAWGGIYPTVLVPWRCEGGVDEASLACQINYQLKGGVQGLLLLGTIGEGQYATMEERAVVIRVAAEVTRGCVPLVVGIHTCDIQTAIAQTLQAQQLGAQAVLVKYTGNPRACCEQVLGFFAELDQNTDLPIFYYHYPSQTGLKLTPQCVAHILALDGVVGIKESTLDLREVEQHICLTRGLGRCFLSGTALNLTQFMGQSGHGAMCPEAVFMPCTAVGAYHAQRMGHQARAISLQEKLFATAPIVRGGMTTERGARTLVMAAQDRQIALPMGNDQPQARMKYALDCLGIPIQPLVKCPLPQLTRFDISKVNNAMRGLVDQCGCEVPKVCCPQSVYPRSCKVERAARLLPE